MAFRLCFLIYVVLRGQLAAYEKEFFSSERIEQAKCIQKGLNDADQAYEEYQKYVSEITLTLANEIEKDLGFVFSGTSGVMQLKVEELGVSFNANRKATIEEARALLLYVINRLANIVNSHEKIQPFLSNYPFTHKNIAISLSFNEMKGQNSIGSVNHVHNVSGVWNSENSNHIFYSERNPFKRELVNLLKESYDDALKQAEIVNLKFPYSHIDTVEEKAIRQVFRSFLLSSANPWVECWSIGEKKDQDEIIEEVGLHLKVIGPHFQNDARKKGIAIAEKLLKTINTSEELKPFLIEYPFPASRLSMHIDFCNSKKGTYDYDDSLTGLELEKNQLTYFYKKIIYQGDETSPIYWQYDYNAIFATESYPEALKLLLSSKESFYEKVKSCLSKKSINQ